MELLLLLRLDIRLHDQRSDSRAGPSGVPKGSTSGVDISISILFGKESILLLCLFCIASPLPVCWSCDASFFSRGGATTCTREPVRLLSAVLSSGAAPAPAADASGAPDTERRSSGPGSPTERRSSGPGGSPTERRSSDAGKTPLSEGFSALPRILSPPLFSEMLRFFKSLSSFTTPWSSIFSSISSLTSGARRTGTTLLSSRRKAATRSLTTCGDTASTDTCAR
mmetsp:Transcript_139714/g.260587  ORF Transcript_139714/g.260587 Transcript_139714/m.260587 type:complete len:225 (+) Transcript_139714:1386-2060(+)